MKDISYNGGVSDTTAVLVDVSNLFGKRILKKINFKIKTGAQEKNELCWRKTLVEVTNSSNISVTDFIQLTKLQRNANNDIFVNVIARIKSDKLALWREEG